MPNEGMVEVTEHVWVNNEHGHGGKRLVAAPGDIISAERAKELGIGGKKARSTEAGGEVRSTDVAPPTRTRKRSPRKRG